MNDLSSLEPTIVWKYFQEISAIPRPSKKEELITDYILAFAKMHKLYSKTDKAGNILIKKPAQKGFKNKPTIVLQSHLDMVCEKNEGTNFNFDTDSIIPVINGEWVKALGTTLGADDGIGIAAQLAVLASNDIEHGSIECLFTIDEETGLTGAFALEKGFIEGNILLNLDSEDEGIIFIGCAGGLDSAGKIKVDKIALPANQKCIRIDVTGLQGGHSGDDINKGLGNSVKIVTRIAKLLVEKFNAKLIDIGGGNLRNAIAREAFVELAIDNNSYSDTEKSIHDLIRNIKIELQFTEKNIKIIITEIAEKTEIISNNSAKQLINILYSLPHGVIGMSHSINRLVETSTNLASIKQVDNNWYEISTSQRSSVNSLKQDIVQQVASVFRLGNAEFKHSTGYPGWEPNTSSPILQKSVDSYKKLFNIEPVVTAIHAGLECGLFLKKYPNLDMISFGPTIKGAHSPDERLEIASVSKFWLLLLDVLKSV